MNFGQKTVQIQQNLAKWFQENKRDLPWRRTRNPYPIWISEIMLQQTTVRAVIPYFERFLEKFPTVNDLANAALEDVKAQWSGLGYYSRAANLWLAAGQIVKIGRFPSSYADLLELKGIGPYTAAAIASIAFEEPVAVIDGNVERVISRLFDISEDVRSSQGKSQITCLAQTLLGKQTPSQHNQAMMELGATVCTPKNPACLVCPISSSCLARKNGTLLLRPVKPKRKTAEKWLWQVDVIFKNKKIALVKSKNGTPWLKNTWVLPGKARKLDRGEKPKVDFKHAITHHDISVQIIRRKTSSKNQDYHWFDIHNVETVGSSSIVRKVLKRLEAKPS